MQNKKREEDKGTKESAYLTFLWQLISSSVRKNIEIIMSANV